VTRSTPKTAFPSPSSHAVVKNGIHVLKSQFVFRTCHVLLTFRTVHNEELLTSYCPPDVLRSRVSSGGIVSDYGLDDRGSIPGRVKGFILYPLCPDRLWGPPSLLYNGYRGSFPRG
jgi:hypothetical protein